MNIVLLNKKSRNSTVIKFKNDVPYISYKAMDEIPWLTHGFSTRLGGVSQGVLSSMNLGFGRGDLEENVVNNHKIIANAIGFESKNIVCSKQTHTTNVAVVGKEFKGNGIYKENCFTDIDGMITNEKNVVLATYFADCVPLYMVDVKNKAIGLAHSGWRGTVGKIGKVTVEKMTEEFQTDPSELYAAIGPSICQDCYEVSEDVIDQFREAFEEKYWDVLFYRKPDGKYQLNLWEANRRIFLDAGIKEERISMPGICTCCNPLFLYSHRASHGKRGNLGAFITVR